MTGKRPSADILPWEHWAPFCRDAKRKPDTFSMIKAAEHKRIAENARRCEAAMEQLDHIPSDSEVER